MSPSQQFLQLLNFFSPALVVGAVAAMLSKLLWRRQLGTVSVLRLATAAVAAGAIASFSGLVIAGRDGTMATYGAMVLCIAGAIWLVGFGPFRRRSG
jgi:Na+/citrate or Na+/malate symporter